MLRSFLFLTKKISTPTTYQGLHGTSHGIVFLYGCVLIFQACGTLLYSALMSIFISIQYTDSLTKSLVFSVPTWLLCNHSSICLCKRKCIFIFLPFMAIPSIIASSFLIGLMLSWMIPHHFCVGSLVLCMCLSLWCLHPLRLLPVCLLLMCILVCLLMMYLYVHVSDSWYLFSVW